MQEKSTTQNMTATFPEGIPLTPRSVPIIAYDRKYCSLTNSKLTITLKPGSSEEGNTFQVREQDTGNLKFSCFKSPNKWKSIFREQTLKEEEDVGEEFRLRTKLVSIHNQTYLYKDDHLICTFTNCSGPESSDKAKILAEFRDTAPPRKARLLVLKGKLGVDKYATIYLGDPKKEGVRPVGKITRIQDKDKKGKKNDKAPKEETYQLDVAGGIDFLVILGMCVNFLVEKFRAPKTTSAQMLK